MKIKRLILLLFVSMLMFFSRPGYASTDYIEVVLEVANNVVNKAGKVQEEIASKINGFITEKLAKLAGDYMEAKKKLKKAERIKKRIEKTNEKIEKIKKRAEKAKKRKEAMMKKIAKLKEKAAKLQEKYNKAMKVVNQFKEDVAEVKGKIEEAKAIVEDGIAMAKDAQDTINNLSSTVDGLKSAATSKVEEAKAQVSDKVGEAKTKINTKSKASQEQQTPVVQEKTVNPVTVLPAAEEVETLAQQTVITVEGSEKINTQEILKTDVSADDIMRLSETSDVNALNAASEIGELSIQEQLRRLNTDTPQSSSNIKQSKAALEKAKQAISKAQTENIKKDIKVKESSRTTFGTESFKLNAVNATKVLMQEATHE